MKPAGTQQDRNMNFDGMENIAPKGSTKYAHNQWSGHSNDGRTVNYGRGPLVGNNGTCPDPHTPSKSVTKDAYRRAPDRVGSGAAPRNADAINVGAQYRGIGGTAVKKPGNPDSIRAGQSGGNSYGEISRGRRPVAPGSTEGINYGPKSQY